MFSVHSLSISPSDLPSFYLSYTFISLTLWVPYVAEVRKSLAVERIAVCFFTVTDLNSPEKGVQELAAVLQSW